MSGAMMRVGLDLQLALGRAIRLRREALGLTRAQLAERLGTHRQIVVRVETGGRSLMLSTIELYASGLRCLPSELVAEAERLVEEARMQEAAE